MALPWLLTAVLKPGVVQVIENDGKASKYFVSGGTITVNEDSSVQVLAEEAHNVSDIDTGEARQLLSKYQSALSSASTDVVSMEYLPQCSLTERFMFSCRQKRKLPLLWNAARL